MQPGAHYGHQVAGHGVLQLYGDAHIAKPKVDREYVFYERAQKTPDLAFVSKWMPSYFGIVRSSEKGTQGMLYPDDYFLMFFNVLRIRNFGRSLVRHATPVSA